MTIKITNSRFVTNKLVSANGRASLPDVTIGGSDIYARDIGFEQRDARQTKPVSRSKPHAHNNSRVTYSFPPVCDGVKLKQT